MSDKVKSIDDAREKAGEVLDKAKTAVEEGVGAARGKLDSVKESAAGVRKKVDEAGAAAKVKVDATVDNLKQGYDKVRKDLDGLSADVNDYVRDNPGRSVLIAAGIGFVVGLMLRGGRR